MLSTKKTTPDKGLSFDFLGGVWKSGFISAKPSHYYEIVVSIVPIFGFKNKWGVRAFQILPWNGKVFSGAACLCPAISFWPYVVG